MAKRYRFSFKRLDVYQEAVKHFDWTCEVVRRLPKGPWRVVDQHYRYAQGSTFESATHLDALSSLKVISDAEYNAQEERLSRIAAMLTRLMQRQRRQARSARRASAARKEGGRQTASLRASGVAEGAERPPAIDPSRSEVAGRAKRARAIDTREAGRRGRGAPEGDRTRRGP